MGRIQFCQLSNVSLYLGAMNLVHPSLLSPLSSDEDTKAKSYIIVAINALIWGKISLDIYEVSEVKGGSCTAMPCTIHTPL